MRKITLTFIFAISLATISFAQTNFRFAHSIPLPAPEGFAPFHIKTGNIDNDAYVDILIGTYIGDSVLWYKNNGDETFTLQTIVSDALDTVGGIALADIDDDGDNDILATSFANGKLVWFANDGLGNFGAEQVIDNTVIEAEGITITTIDAGATLDIAVVSYSGNETVWFPNNGGGTFGPKTIIDNTISGPSSLDLKDVDGDGDVDAVITNALDWDIPNDSRIEVFYNSLAQNSMVTFTKDPNSVTTTKDFLFDVHFEDIDGDTNLDIIATDLGAAGIDGTLSWYKKEIDGTYTEHLIATSIENPSQVLFKDLDNDSQKDIVLNNGLSGINNNDIIWYKNNGTGYDSEIVIDATQSQPYKMVIADLDNDGDLDIASIDFNWGDLNIIMNEQIVASIDDNSVSKINVSPNPAQDILKFTGLSFEKQNISIFNNLGQKVMETTIESNQSINISKLQGGFYIIKFDNYSNSLKFIKG